MITNINEKQNNEITFVKTSKEASPDDRLASGSETIEKIKTSIVDFLLLENHKVV